MQPVQPYTGQTNYQLVVTDKVGVYHFLFSDIVRLEANDNYTVFYFQKRRPFVASKVLKVYDALLRPYGFLRTHRSHLVNKTFIHKIEGKKIWMQDASCVDIANRRRARIGRALQGPGTMSTLLKEGIQTTNGIATICLATQMD